MAIKKIALPRKGDFQNFKIISYQPTEQEPSAFSVTSKAYPLIVLVTGMDTLL